MKLLKLFIDRPVVSCVLALIFLLLGYYCYSLLPMRAYPKLPSWQVSVVTNFYGASPQVMESSVSKPLERSLTGLDNLDYMTSDNSQGSSVITLNFNIGSDINSALANVSAHVHATMWQLPEGVNAPQVSIVNPNQGATGVDIWYAMSSQKMSIEQISDYATNVIVPKLESLPNVYSMVIFGASNSQMSVQLNPDKMAAHSIDATDIFNTLNNNNVYSQGGQVIGKHFVTNVSLDAQLKKPQQFNNLILKRNADGSVVQLKDVGRAVIKVIDPPASGLFDGKPMVALGVVPTDKANAIEISSEVRKAMADAQLSFPAGLHADILLDQSLFSKASIHEVKTTIVISVCCVFAVIFLFLGSLRSLSVPMVTIPLSLLGSCIVMYWLGYSLNTLTLLSWVLAIGLVVDDAIVVIENIHRHIAKRMTIKQATWLGLKEITPAVIAMTIVVCVVFLPIGFIGGYTGALFKQFAFGMAIVVALSGVLALFVSPMMCSYLLRPEKPGDLSTRIDSVMDRLRASYQNLLQQVVKWRYISVILLVAGVCGGYFVSTRIASELAPTENEGILVSVFMGPFGQAVKDTIHKIKPAAMKFGQLKEIKHFGMFAGLDPNNANTHVGNFGMSFMIMKPHQPGMLTEDELLKKVNGIVHYLPSMFAMAVKMPTLPAATTSDVQLVLKTHRSTSDLNAAVTKLTGYLAQHDPKLLNLQSSLVIKQPVVNVTIDHLKAQQMGVSIKEINSTLLMLMGKPHVSNFNHGDYSYPVVPQAYSQFRDNVRQIQYYFVKNDQGKMIPLSSLVHLQSTVGPTSLSDFNQVSSSTITASLAQGYSAGTAIDDISNAVKTQLSADYSLDYAQQSRQFMQSQNKLFDVFIIALIAIYFLLAVMYNDFIDPLIVMLGVIPLSVCFAIYTMFVTGCTFNIYTKIGLIMLVGLITKHGIMIVNFANEYRAETGCSITEAVIQGCGIRLRPILMTTFAMIFGALPLVISTGAGFAARHQIGWTIIGGMALGTLLSLFMVPCIYILLKAFKEFFIPVKPQGANNTQE